MKQVRIWNRSISVVLLQLGQVAVLHDAALHGSQYRVLQRVSHGIAVAVLPSRMLESARGVAMVHG